MQRAQRREGRKLIDISPLACFVSRMPDPPTMDRLRPILKQYWGYDSFRPLQAEAMNCVLEGRDSVVVLPTGGGKSLCYQVPAIAMPGMAVIVSPLISLMKDQVDALTDCGVPAGCLNSALLPDERRSLAERIRAGTLKLFYVAPERLTADGFIDFLKKMEISFFAIDEAHCISTWGHDFRKDYRELRILKQTFPKLGVHGYTATATQRVREDIANELLLRDPAVHVGSFDRPNLAYRILRRVNKWAQVCNVIDRHRSESGIIYGISRKGVDNLCAALRANGYSALPYHAGMEDADRKRNQEAFITEKTAIIVATVAFGMGIDKSNVRYIIHAGAPKSVEHYQQESGRAGRDGLEAECVLLYSGSDFVIWRRLLRDLEPEARRIALKKLAEMEDFSTSATCRHKFLVNYFGQIYTNARCDACDICLDDAGTVDDPLVIAQKILSCVVRLKERFGAEYTASVLIGSKEKRIRDFGHDKLKTWGTISEVPKTAIRNWIDQLAAQGYLERDGEFKTLRVTPKGWTVIKGAETPHLRQPAAETVAASRVTAESWEGVDRDLFEELRVLRREIAEAKRVPSFVVFSDVSLRDMARRRPSTPGGFLRVTGVGQTKCDTYGQRFLECIVTYCREKSLAMDIVPSPVGHTPIRKPILSAAKYKAFELFKAGQSLADVARAVERKPSTISTYLAEFIEEEHLTDVSAWIDETVKTQVRQAAATVGMEYLKPIFEHLGGAVDYETIRIAVACLRNEKITPTETQSELGNRI